MRRALRSFLLLSCVGLVPATAHTQTSARTPSPGSPAPAPASPQPPTPRRPHTGEPQLPTSTAELVALLRTRHDEVKALLDGGQHGVVYAPALRTKDVALALEDRLAELPAEVRMAASDAVRRVTVSAWQLEEAGDGGDLVTVTRTYERFSSAVSALLRAYDRR